MIPMRYSEARGTLIYEKNLKSKISCRTPFKLQTQVSAPESIKRFTETQALLTGDTQED
jgi:hypothetical protein